MEALMKIMKVMPQFCQFTMIYDFVYYIKDVLLKLSNTIISCCRVGSVTWRFVT